MGKLRLKVVVVCGGWAALVVIELFEGMIYVKTRVVTIQNRWVVTDDTCQQTHQSEAMPRRTQPLSVMTQLFGLILEYVPPLL